MLERGAVVIERDRVAAVDAGRPRGAGVRLDATGHWVLPGFVDTHSHHREPGYTNKEDITAATTAAAAGGVTTSVGMPNVQPPVLSLEAYEATLAIYGRKALVDYNVNPSPTVVGEVSRLAAAGALAFKVFQVVDSKRSYPHVPGLGVTDDGEMLEVLERVVPTGLPVMVHPHNQQLMDRFEKRHWERGDTGPMAYAEAQRTYDGLLWNTAIQTLLLLQVATGARLHVLHLVTRQSIDMIRTAKADGRSVTAEVNPFALFLGDRTTIRKSGPRVLGRWVPPDVKAALWRAIRDGTVDVLGSDHAPHTLEEKEAGWRDMWQAPSGTPQLQDYLTQLLERGVRRERISLDTAVRIGSYNPARIFGLYPRKGTLEPGADADVVVVDPDAQITHRDDRALSKCGWTPYDGQRARGTPIHTLVRGRFVYRDGKVVGEPGWGRPAARVDLRT
jgi:dihydroorotase (multifunctional complex type)